MAVSAPAKAAFEGSYDMELSSDGEKVLTTLWTKDGHVRMKLSGATEMPGEMILRDGMRKMLLIMPEQRMYMEMAIPEVKGSAADDPGPDAAPPFTRTGEKREILGYAAHEFILEDGANKVVIWATEDLGSMAFANNPMLEGWADAMGKVTGLSAFFPLEMTGFEKGKQAYRMTIRRIEPGKLADSLFEPPPGFMKMTMPAGMGGFMGR
jgi:hypothetical protein